MPSESAVPPAVVQGEDWPIVLRLDGLNPDSMAVPGPDAYVILHGEGFTPESVVIWDEDEMPAEFVNKGKLRLLVVNPGILEEDEQEVELPHEIPVAVQTGAEISNTLLFTFTLAEAKKAARSEAKTPEKEDKHAKHHKGK